MPTPVYVVSTCIPGDTSPCFPSVFASYDEAENYMERIMREEWQHNAPTDDAGKQAEYPGNWLEAQEMILAGQVGSDGALWGAWAITSHTI